MRGFRRRKGVPAISLTENDPQTESLFLLNRRIGIAQLTNETCFNSRELKAMYRSFKIICPSAMINKELFRNIFSEFFKKGDVDTYADLVFNAINTSRTGYITFLEYAISLSILWRGTLEQRIEWMYRLYDPLNYKSISWQNFLHLIMAVNDLVDIGRRQNYSTDMNIKRAQELFLKFNSDINSAVSKEEFVRVCQADPSICESLDSIQSMLLFKF